MRNLSGHRRACWIEPRFRSAVARGARPGFLVALLMTCDSFHRETWLELSFRRAQRGGISVVQGACLGQRSDSSRAMNPLHDFMCWRALRNDGAAGHGAPLLSQRSISRNDAASGDVHIQDEVGATPLSMRYVRGMPNALPLSKHFLKRCLCKAQRSRAQRPARRWFDAPGSAAPHSRWPARDLCSRRAAD